jgi:glycyl-tRNA synthetase
LVDMETIVNLCKARGFVFQSSEIYGGIGSSYDYGPLGVELKRNVKEAWWRDMVATRDDIVGLDSAIILNPKVWEASGHLEHFTDPLVDCKQCRQRFRADDIEGDRCPVCCGELTDPRQFNTMFKTFIGPVEDDASVAYLRPETCQGIFINFVNILHASRKKLPFGVAQIGKSFRNEITPGNFIFRTREFEQMEMEYFVYPGTDEEWFDYWVNERFNWYVKYGIKKENLRLRQHPKEQLSHYSKATTDIEYNYPFGWAELEGIANRTDFDLTAHSKASGKDLTYFDEAKGEHITPYVIEPAAGADRATLVFLLDAYEVETFEKGGKKDKRTVLRFHKDIAPVKAAVMPLLRNRPDLVETAKKLAQDLQKAFPTMYDDTGSIGRLYRRQDEIGTLWCITVDVQTVEEDNQVTIRDRDTMQQIRMPIEGVKKYLIEQLGKNC